MKHSVIKLMSIMAVMLLLTGCAAKTPWYEGYYFDAKVNGLQVVEIEDKSSIKSLEGFSRYGHVKWMVKEQAKGDLDVVVNNNKISNEFIGEVGNSNDADVYIYALDGQDLESEAGQSTSKGVSVDGANVVKSEEFMTSDYMPAGAYVISVKTVGSENWDRKYIYVEFK